MATSKSLIMKKRFRGFLPIVIDVETGGARPDTDALLETACVFIEMDEQGHVYRGETFGHHHVKPFEGSRLDPKAMEINKINIHHPFRLAISEHEALNDIFDQVCVALERHKCQRAVLVGHNAWFDLHFIKAASKRSNIDKFPFHSFTTFDTATLGGAVFGETVLSKVVKSSGFPFNADEAHSAIYDAEKTADAFCYLVNHCFQPKTK